MPKTKFSISHKDDEMLELVRKTGQKTLAVWAIDCAERVMPFLRNNIHKIIAPGRLSRRSGCG
jgi:hypothetical protein